MMWTYLGIILGLAAVCIAIWQVKIARDINRQTQKQLKEIKGTVNNVETTLPDPEVLERIVDIVETKQE